MHTPATIDAKTFRFLFAPNLFRTISPISLKHYENI